MNYGSIFNKEIFENVIWELNVKCRITRGFSAQIAGSDTVSATTTSIITYVLSKLGCLSTEEKRSLEEDILSFKINKDGFYRGSIGNEKSPTVWSTSQSCFSLSEIGTKEELFLDSIEWLCDVQLKDGGWSYNGEANETSRIVYCLYTVMALSKITNKNLKIETTINKAIQFIKSYRPKDTCEKLIQYFLLITLKVQERNDAQEKILL